MVETSLPHILVGALRWCFSVEADNIFIVITELPKAWAGQVSFVNLYEEKSLSVLRGVDALTAPAGALGDTRRSGP
ncbi:hypothetical protein M501DRAFT_998039 [Patellaria atrata CBS 101060]|uniref:Uncharacterized protein n=1 Tax=Patellaria atrata CBS 101060 TaxID=1346257 RepID=A0A9P4VSA2_9PEZI|nr:hypothetical protein M501DRAFT_998039 [Patellaria atrata CBS 101060]